MADSYPKRWYSIFERYGIASAIFLTSFVLTGCSHWTYIEKETSAVSLQPERESDMNSWQHANVEIDGLEKCTAFSKKTSISNKEQPIVILVHGLRGSAKSFSRLAQHLQSLGQQPFCFLYNDRDSLVSSSAKLAESIQLLVSQTGKKEIVVLGHSLGALVARRALVSEHWENSLDQQMHFKLITVSGPFGGISTASGCTSPTMKFLTLGLVIPLCKMVSGDKWAEITFRSEFIRYPGMLSRNVSIHLKIETDEEYGCLAYDEKICRTNDFVFSLDEQRNASIDSDQKVRVVMVKAGHVGVLGNEHIAPLQLVSTLEKNRILPMPGNRFAKTDNNLAQSQGNSAGSSGHSEY